MQSLNLKNKITCYYLGRYNLRLLVFLSRFNKDIIVTNTYYNRILLCRFDINKCKVGKSKYLP